MTAQLSKDSIDIGIVTTNAPECLAFYRDVLGFEDVGESPVPGSTIHQLLCGTSSVKLMLPGRHAPGLPGARGDRRPPLQRHALQRVLLAEGAHPVRAVGVPGVGGARCPP